MDKEAITRQPADKLEKVGLEEELALALIIQALCTDTTAADRNPSYLR